jgi:hypothetical protein
MAKRTARGRPAPRGDQRIRGVTTAQAAQLLDASMIPRVLVSTVDGAEALAVGVLQLARSVLVTVLSGTVDVSTQAVSASAGVARGTVGAASRLLGELGGVAQRTVEATVAGAQSLGAELGKALRAPRPRPAARTLATTEGDS